MGTETPNKIIMLLVGMILGALLMSLTIIATVESSNELHTMLGSHFVRVQSDNQEELVTMCSISMQGAIKVQTEIMVIDANGLSLTMPCNSKVFKKITGS